MKFAKKLPEAMDHHFAPDIPIGSSARGRRSRAVHAVPKLAAMAVSETKWIHESSLKNGDTVGCPFPWQLLGETMIELAILGYHIFLSHISVVSYVSVHVVVRWRTRP